MLGSGLSAKRVHRRRWWICCGAFTGCSTRSRESLPRQRHPSTFVMITRSLSGERKRTERQAGDDRGNEFRLFGKAVAQVTVR